MLAHLQLYVRGEKKRDAILIYLLEKSCHVNKYVQQSTKSTYFDRLAFTYIRALNWKYYLFWYLQTFTFPHIKWEKITWNTILRVLVNLSSNIKSIFRRFLHSFVYYISEFLLPSTFMSWWDVRAHVQRLFFSISSFDRHTFCLAVLAESWPLACLILLSYLRLSSLLRRLNLSLYPPLTDEEILTAKTETNALLCHSKKP